MGARVWMVTVVKLAAEGLALGTYHGKHSAENDVRASISAHDQVNSEEEAKNQHGTDVYETQPAPEMYESLHMYPPLHEICLSRSKPTLHERISLLTDSTQTRKNNISGLAQHAETMVACLLNHSFDGNGDKNNVFFTIIRDEGFVAVSVLECLYSIIQGMGKTDAFRGFKNVAVMSRVVIPASEAMLNVLHHRHSSPAVRGKAWSVLAAGVIHWNPVTDHRQNVNVSKQVESSPLYGLYNITTPHFGGMRERGASGCEKTLDEEVQFSLFQELCRSILSLADQVEVSSVAKDSQCEGRDTTKSNDHTAILPAEVDPIVLTIIAETRIIVKNRLESVSRVYFS